MSKNQVDYNNPKLEHDNKAGTLDNDRAQEMSPIRRLDWKNPEVLIDYFRLKYPNKHKDAPITGKTLLTRFFEVDEMFLMLIAGPLWYVEEALKFQRYKMAVGVCFYNALTIPEGIKGEFKLQCPEISATEIANITLGEIVKRMKILTSLLNTRRPQTESRPRSTMAEVMKLPRGETISGFLTP